MTGEIQEKTDKTNVPLKPGDKPRQISLTYSRTCGKETDVTQNQSEHDRQVRAEWFNESVKRLWSPDGKHEKSEYEKILTTLKGKNREELLAYLKELEEKFFPNVGVLDMITSKHGILGLYFLHNDDDKLRRFIARIQISISDSNLETEKAITQIINMYRGRQKGRAYRSFP